MGRGYLGEFEQIVLLAVWRLGAEAYGVRIRQEIDERVGRPVTIGAIYVTLERLAGKGLLKSRTGEPTAARGGRAKRFYAITPAGVAAAEDAKRQLAAMWKGLSARRLTP
jgi:PadR family transcriptional regulator